MRMMQNSGNIDYWDLWWQRWGWRRSRRMRTTMVLEGWQLGVRAGDLGGQRQQWWWGWLLESVPTVLTQPGTPVSFRGMLFRSLFDFRKLRNFRCFPFPENSGTPTFPISGNSGLRRFPRFSYYVITLISCLHLSLVTPSAVGNTSLSPDPQFPLTLPYCLAYVTQFPLLCTGTTLVHSLVISTCILYLDH